MEYNGRATKRTTDVEIEENISFNQMMLSNRVLLGLNKNGFTHPSPIQLRAIPLGIGGRDLLMQAKSGTGKTLVFVTIIMERYRNEIETPQSLIITPTRELAVQIEDILKNIGAESKGFRVGSFIGGMNVIDDRKKIQKCKAIVGTPGRIVHLIKNKILYTSGIRILVLDEIDKLMTDTFSQDVDFIFKGLPKKLHVIGSSATYSKSVETKMQEYMKNPIGVTPKKEPPILLGVKQFIYNLQMENPTPIKEMFEKVKALLSIFSTVPFIQCLVFSNSQHRAESYSNYLSNEGWACELIMGSQEQPTRLDVFKKFKDFKCRILLATDLMARGIDADKVNLVINLEVPNESSLYLHRIGRCGRFGSQGIAITLVHTNDELIKFQTLLGSIGGSEMKVLNFPKKDRSNIWNICDHNTDVERYGEIRGIDKTEHIGPSMLIDMMIRKNLDRLNISKLLVDKPENNSIANDEDLFESYSMVVNGSFNASEIDSVSTSDNNPVDTNRQFIDAISRLNIYPDEALSNIQHESNSSTDVNESSSNHDDNDDSNIGTHKLKYASQCSESESDCSTGRCYTSSVSEKVYDLDLSCRSFSIDENDSNEQNNVESKWNAQFMDQIYLIQNYVINSKNLKRRVFPQSANLDKF